MCICSFMYTVPKLLLTYKQFNRINIYLKEFIYFKKYKILTSPGEPGI